MEISLHDVAALITVLSAMGTVAVAIVRQVAVIMNTHAGGINKTLKVIHQQQQEMARWARWHEQRDDDRFAEHSELLEEHAALLDEIRKLLDLEYSLPRPARRRARGYGAHRRAPAPTVPPFEPNVAGPLAS